MAGVHQDQPLDLLVRHRVPEHAVGTGDVDLLVVDAAVIEQASKWNVTVHQQDLCVEGARLRLLTRGGSFSPVRNEEDGTHPRSFRRRADRAIGRIGALMGRFSTSEGETIDSSNRLPDIVSDDDVHLASSRVGAAEDLRPASSGQTPAPPEPLQCERHPGANVSSVGIGQAHHRLERAVNDRGDEGRAIHAFDAGYLPAGQRN